MNFEVITFLRVKIKEERPKLKELFDATSKYFNFELLSSDTSFIQQQYCKIVCEEWTNECLDILETKTTSGELKDDDILELLNVFRSLDAYEKIPNFLKGVFFELIRTERDAFTIKDFIKPQKEISDFLIYKLINFERNSKLDFEFYTVLIDLLRNSYLKLGELCKYLKIEDFVNNKITIFEVSRNVLMNDFEIEGYNNLKEISEKIEDEHSMVKSLIQRDVKKCLEKSTEEVFLNGGKKILKIHRKLMLSDDLDVQFPEDVTEIHIICDILHVDKDLPDSYRGKNIFVFSNTIRLHQKSTWNTSGRDKPQKYYAGAGALSNGDGKNGEDGQPGESGGNCEIFSVEINKGELWTLKSIGGNGSNGQDGGNGSDGLNGRNVQTDDFKLLNQNIQMSNFVDLLSQLGISTENGSRQKKFFENGLEKILMFNRTSTHTELLMMIKGSSGKIGGLGGFGGYGGYGGYAGKINVECKNKDFEIEAIDGLKGSNGLFGFNGKTGRDGRDAFMKISTLETVPQYLGIDAFKKYKTSIGTKRNIFSIYYEAYKNYVGATEIETIQSPLDTERSTLEMYTSRLASDEQNFFDFLLIVLNNSYEKFSEVVKALNILELIDAKIDYTVFLSKILENSFDICSYGMLQSYAKFYAIRSTKIETQVRNVLRSYIEDADINLKADKIYEFKKKIVTTKNLNGISENFDELHVICAILHIDSELSNSFRGKKLAIYADQIKVHKSIEFNLSGFDDDGSNVNISHANGGDFFINCNESINSSLLTIKSNGGSARNAKSGVDANQEDFHVKGRSVEEFSSIKSEYKENEFTKKLVKNLDTLLIVEGSEGTKRRIGKSGYININSNTENNNELKIIAMDGTIENFRDGRDAVLCIKDTIENIIGLDKLNKYELMTSVHEWENSVSYESKVYFPKCSREITDKTGIDDIELCENLIWVLRNSFDQYDNVVQKLDLLEYSEGKISLKQVLEKIQQESFDIGNYNNLKKSTINFFSNEKYQNPIQDYIKQFLGSKIIVTSNANIITVKNFIYKSSDFESLSVDTDTTEIQIICDTLHIDSNLPMKFRGKNLAILANYVQVQKKVVWDLSGLPAKSNYSSKRAGENSDGTGEHGVDGKAGNSGGNFSLNCKLIENLRALMFVSNGSDGINGQDGGYGQNGENGRDTTTNSFKKNGENWSLLNYFEEKFTTDDGLTAYCYNRETFFSSESYILVKGTDGKPGKSGGLPGYGGKGGFTGKISIIENGINQTSIKIIQNSGVDGQLGSAGYNGARGRDGKDIARYIASYYLNFEEHGADRSVRYTHVWNKNGWPHIYVDHLGKYLRFQERVITTPTRTENTSKLTRDRQFFAVARKNSPINMDQIKEENSFFLSNTSNGTMRNVLQLNQQNLTTSSAKLLFANSLFEMSITDMEMNQQQYIQKHSEEVYNALMAYKEFRLKEPSSKLNAVQKSDILVNVFLSKYSETFEMSKSEIMAKINKYRDVDTKIEQEQVQSKYHTAFQVKFYANGQSSFTAKYFYTETLYFDLLNKLVRGGCTSDLLEMVKGSNFNVQKYKYLAENLSLYEVKLSQRNFIDNKKILNKALEGYIKEYAKESTNTEFLKYYQMYHNGVDHWINILETTDFIESFFTSLKGQHPFFLIGFFKNSIPKFVVNIDDVIMLCQEKILLKFYQEIYWKICQKPLNSECKKLMISTNAPKFLDMIGYLKDTQILSFELSHLYKQFSNNTDIERKEILEYFNKNIGNYTTDLPEAMFNLLSKYSKEFEDSRDVLDEYTKEAHKILEKNVEIKKYCGEKEEDMQHPITDVISIFNETAQIELRPKEVFYQDPKKEFIKLLEKFFNDEDIIDLISDEIEIFGIHSMVYRRLLAHKYNITLTIFAKDFDGNFKIIEQHNYKNKLNFQYDNLSDLHNSPYNSEPTKDFFLLQKEGNFSSLNFEVEKYHALERRQELESKCREIVNQLNYTSSQPAAVYINEVAKKFDIRENKFSSIFDDDNFLIDIDTLINIILSYFPYILIKYDDHGVEEFEIDEKIDEKIKEISNKKTRYEIQNDEDIREAIKLDLSIIAGFDGLPILKAIAIRLYNDKIFLKLQEFAITLKLILELMGEGHPLKHFLTFVLIGNRQENWPFELILLKLEKNCGLFDENLKKKWRNNANKIHNKKIFQLFLEKITDTDESKIELKANEFDEIFENLSYFDEHDYSNLKNTNLSSWKFLTYERYWKKELEKLKRNKNEEIKNFEEIKVIFEDLNSIYGTKAKKLLKVLQEKKQESEGLEIKEFIENFKSGEWHLSDETFDILTTQTPKKWVSELTKHYSSESVERKSREIVRLIKDDPETSKNIKDSVEYIGNQVQAIFGLFCLKEDKRFMEFDENDIKRWRANFNNQPILESLAIITRMFQIKKNITLRDTQLMTILMMWNSDNGVLMQVSTGEGKTFIGVSFAILKLFYGQKIDILTSSSVLAVRDSEESREYFNFFGLSVDHNCHVNVEQQKKAYTSDVVYGILGNFQRDYLLTEFFNENFLSERKRTNILVDEVDSMLLDKGNNILYLSSDIPDIDEIESIFIFIWEYVNQEFYDINDAANSLDKTVIRKVILDSVYGLLEEDDIKNMDPNVNTDKIIQILKNANIIDDKNLIQKQYYSDELCDKKLYNFDENIREKIKIFCRSKIEKEKIAKVPNYLKQFILLHLDKWIESALRALVLQNENEYIIDRQSNGYEMSTDPNIIILDLDTGTDLLNSQWDEGLHQFIQLKHGCKLSQISLKSVFISNVSYFKKYSKLYGMTGTLGSIEERKRTTKMNQVDYATIPRYTKRRFTEYPPILENEPNKWIERILNEVIDMFNKNRSVLIICETIKDTKIIQKQLLTNSSVFSKANVQIYLRDTEIFKFNKLNSKHVIIATNLAGRGTDIKLTNELKNANGLHVVLTYLPQNARIENQAFGRAARSGDKGSGRLIIKTEYEESIFNIKSTRNKKELERLDDVVAYYENFIQIEEEFFGRFHETYRKFKEKNDKATGTKKSIFPIYAENFKLQWSFWLDENSVHLDNWKTSNVQHQVYASLNNFLSSKATIHPVKRIEVFKFFDEKRDHDKAKDSILKNFEVDSIAFQYYKCYTIIKANQENNKHRHRDLYHEEQIELMKCLKMLEERIDRREMYIQIISSTKQKYQESLIPIEAYENQQKKLIEIDGILINSIYSLLGQPITPNIFKSSDTNNYNDKDVFVNELYNMLLVKDCIIPPKISSLPINDDVKKVANIHNIEYEKLRKFISSKMNTNIQSLVDFSNEFNNTIQMSSREKFWNDLVEKEILTDTIEYAIIDLNIIRNVDPSIHEEIKEKLTNEEMTTTKSTEIYLTTVLKNESKFVVQMQNFRSQFSSERFNYLMENDVIEINKKANFNIEKFNQLKNDKIFDQFDEIKVDDFKKIFKNHNRIVEKLTKSYENNRTILTKRGNDSFMLNYENVNLIETNSEIDVFSEDQALQEIIIELIKSKFAYRIALECLALDISRRMEKADGSNDSLNTIVIRLPHSPHLALMNDLVRHHIIDHAKADSAKLGNIDKALNFFKLYGLNLFVMKSRLGYHNGIFSTDKTEKFLCQNYEAIVLDQDNIKELLVQSFQELRNENFNNVDVVLKPLDDFLKKPEERKFLEFMKSKGMDMVIQVDEKRYSFDYWMNFLAVMAIALVQIVVGAVLTIISMGIGCKVGEFFLSEGIGDAIFMLGTLKTGTFSWKDYETHKKLSVIISLTFCAASTLFSKLKYIKQSTNFSTKISQKLRLDKVTSISKIIKSGGDVGKTAMKETFKQFGKVVVSSTTKAITQSLVGYAADELIEKLLDGITKAVSSEIVNTLMKNFWTHDLSATIDNMLLYYYPKNVTDLIFKKFEKLLNDQQMFTDISDRIIDKLDQLVQQNNSSPNKLVKCLMSVVSAISKIVEISSISIFTSNTLNATNIASLEFITEKTESDRIESKLSDEQIKEMKSNIIDYIKNKLVDTFQSAVNSSVVKPFITNIGNQIIRSAKANAFSYVKDLRQNFKENKYRKTTNEIIEKSENGKVSKPNMEKVNNILANTNDPQVYAKLVKLDIPMNSIAINAASEVIKKQLGNSYKIIVEYEGRRIQFGDISSSDAKVVVVKLKDGHFENSKNTQFGNNCFFDALTDQIPQLKDKIIPQDFRNEIANVMLTSRSIQNEIKDPSKKLLMQAKFLGGWRPGENPTADELPQIGGRKRLKHDNDDDYDDDDYYENNVQGYKVSKSTDIFDSSPGHKFEVAGYYGHMKYIHRGTLTNEFEVHHQPTNSSMKMIGIDRKDCPSILLFKPSHRILLSSNSYEESKDYRKLEVCFLLSGRMDLATELGIQDIFTTASSVYYMNDPKDNSKKLLDRQAYKKFGINLDTFENYTNYFKNSYKEYVEFLVISKNKNTGKSFLGKEEAEKLIEKIEDFSKGDPKIIRYCDLLRESRNLSKSNDRGDIEKRKNLQNEYRQLFTEIKKDYNLKEPEEREE